MLRQQLIKGMGGRLFADFASIGRPESATVTIKSATGADLTSAVNGAACTVETGLFTSVEGSADVPAIEGKAIPCEYSGDRPKRGASVEVLHPSGLREINVIGWFYDLEPPPGSDPRVMLVLRNPFRVLPTEGTQVGSTRVFIDLDHLQCDRVASDFRAVFTAEMQGEQFRREVIYDVGLRDTSNPCGNRDPLNAWPDLRDSETYEWQNEFGAQAVDGGWEDVFRRIQATKNNPNRIRDIGPFEPLIVNRAMRRLALVGSVPPAWNGQQQALIDLLDRDFTAGFAEAMQAVSWYDAEDLAIRSEADQAAFAPQRIRFSR